jgi:hypothetical protein
MYPQLKGGMKMNNKIVKKVAVVATLLTMSLGMSLTAFAASESLNGGGATWSGGENSDGILYSQVRDNTNDGLRYKVTVWVKSDDGVKKSKTGTTSGVGKKGQVRISKASTHNNPFVKEKAGYKNLLVVN